MAIVDERGRLFGRWNLLDLAVLVLLAGLIPLAYAGYLLFRDQPPTLVSVSPNNVPEGVETHLTIKGTNLRPYMRASAGTQQARDFVFKSTEEAELPFVFLPAGRYDIVLYDSAQERFRLKEALTVSPAGLPPTEIIAVGAFGNLDAAGAAKLTPGTPLAGAGAIVAVGKPVADLTRVFSGSKLIGVPVPNALRLPAAISLRCHVRVDRGTPVCILGEVTLAPSAFLKLDTPLGNTGFQLDQVRGPQPLQQVPITMRLSAAQSILGRVKPGDTDTGGAANELAVLSRVERVGTMRSRSENFADVDVSLIASLQRVDDRWLYDSAPLRVGSTILLRTVDYEVAGLVTEIGTPKQ
jgi:hypothetical protein